MSDFEMNRRQFLKRLLALGALVPAAGLVAGCDASTDGSADSAKAAGSSQDPDETTVESGSAAESSTSADGMGSALVVYYSAQGHTERVAQTIATHLGSDYFALTPAQPYSQDDLNYNDDNSRVCKEHDDENRDVALEQVTPDSFAGYDTVFVGYPIWWGDAAWPIDNFIKGNDFMGKKIVPFCTSASSSLGDSDQLLKEMAGSGDWQEGRRFSSGVSDDEVIEWLDGLAL